MASHAASYNMLMRTPLRCPANAVTPWLAFPNAGAVFRQPCLKKIGSREVQQSGWRIRKPGDRLSPFSRARPWRRSYFRWTPRLSAKPHLLVVSGPRRRRL